MMSTVEDMTTRIEREVFLSYAPETPPGFIQALSKINECQCFKKKTEEIKWEKDRRSRGGSKNCRNRFVGPKNQTAKHTPRPRLFSSDIPMAHRVVIDSINKISDDNYKAILARLTRSLDENNIPFAVDFIMNNAYIQMERCRLFVALLTDIHRFLDSKKEFVYHLNQKVVMSVSNDILYPKVDPLKDYDKFCQVSKMKKRDVGMCNIMSALLRSAKTEPEMSLQEFYSFYEDMTKRYMRTDNVISTEEDVDIVGSIENLLGCIKVIIDHDTKVLRQRFRCAANDFEAIPSKKCEFLIRDILME